MDFGCIFSLSFFSDKILISYCESQQSLVDLLTSSVFTLLSSFVCLHGDISIYLHRMMF